MRYILLACLLGVAVPVTAGGLTDGQVDRIVDAIYVIEGGSRARVPYGIVSVPVRGRAHARSVCRRTVVNNYRRWREAGMPGEFLDFLADRYIPPSVDRDGNINWKRNIKSRLYGQPNILATR